MDFSTHMSGPMAAHLLRAAGADVIRVEHPSYGDGNRGAAPFIAGVGNAHAGLSGGVRSVTASTRSEQWPTLIRAAAQWADAVIVAGRQTDLTRRGLDFATVKKSNPRVVYCHITGYGLAGPWAGKPAHGQNVDAVAGRVIPLREDGHLVTPTGMRTAGTVLAGVFGAMGTLAALVRRGADGPGEYVHSSLWHSAMWWSWRDANMLANEDRGWHEYRDMGSRYAIYETADGRAILLCPVEKKFWHAFCDVAGVPTRYRDRGDWSEGMEWGFDDEVEVIADRMRTRDLDQWSGLLTACDVPFSPILTLQEAMNSDHARAVDLMVASDVDGKPVTIMSPPWQHAGSPDVVAAEEVPGPPKLGEHSVDVLEEWGLSEFAPSAFTEQGGN
ncbi:CaiB/BaiF CoA-transferase family protein [Streptomyces plumbiresistens]|uniref:CaiB/BaiF CoA transferase family protein n=1 Tax=Streptomyces plumbiresistens TaxID=511811 RepID=UPI0031E8D9C2